jgi:hypothetical protein
LPPFSFFNRHTRINERHVIICDSRNIFRNFWLAKLDAELSCHACQFKLENVLRTGSVQWKNLTVFLAQFLGDVLWRTINLGRQISDISEKSMQATIYCHYD